MFNIELNSIKELAERLGNRFSAREIRAFFPKRLYSEDERNAIIEAIKADENITYFEKNLFEENSTRDEKCLVDLVTMQCLDRYINKLLLFSNTGRFILASIDKWKDSVVYDSITPEESEISEALMSERIELEDLLICSDWSIFETVSEEEEKTADISAFLKNNLLHPKGVDTIIKACEHCLLNWPEDTNQVTKEDVSRFMNIFSYVVFRLNFIKNKITADYQPLISQIVRRYRRGSILRQDLLQEGNIGLLKAIERFDANKGERFSIYASWWIRQEITRAIIYQGSVVRLPVRVFRKVNQIKNLKERISQEQGREPTDSQLAHFSDLSSNEISHLQKVTPIILSLEAGKAADDDRVPLEIADPAYSNLQIEYLEKEGVKERVRELLSCLDQREANIVKRRFGIEFRAPQTLDEIGKFYNLSRERIRQIEAKAIKKMEIFAQKLLENQRVYDTEMLVGSER